MTTRQLYHTLTTAGCRLSVTGDGLRLRVVGFVPDLLRPLVRQHKHALMVLAAAPEEEGLIATMLEEAEAIFGPCEVSFIPATGSTTHPEPGSIEEIEWLAREVAGFVVSVTEPVTRAEVDLAHLYVKYRTWTAARLVLTEKEFARGLRLRGYRVSAPRDRAVVKGLRLRLAAIPDHRVPDGNQGLGAVQ